MTNTYYETRMSLEAALIDAEQSAMRPSMTDFCPKCGSGDWMPADEGAFAACNDCGFTDYDDWTLAIIAEVKREQANCKQVLGYVPTYREAVEKGLAK